MHVVVGLPAALRQAPAQQLPHEVERIGGEAAVLHRRGGHHGRVPPSRAHRRDAQRDPVAHVEQAARLGEGLAAHVGGERHLPQPGTPREEAQAPHHDGPQPVRAHHHPRPERAGGSVLVDPHLHGGARVGSLGSTHPRHPRPLPHVHTRGARHVEEGGVEAGACDAEALQAFTECRRDVRCPGADRPSLEPDGVEREDRVQQADAGERRERTGVEALAARLRTRKARTVEQKHAAAPSGQEGGRRAPGRAAAHHDDVRLRAAHAFPSSTIRQGKCRRTCAPRSPACFPTSRSSTGVKERSTERGPSLRVIRFPRQSVAARARAPQ